VKQCRDLPGQELFQYRDEIGAVVDVGSADVNAYLKEITGRDFTSKDFRTWAGTVLAATLLRDFEAVDSDARKKKNIVQAVEQVAKQLGNTRAVCRKCYVHPAVLDAYLDGTMLKTVSQRAARTARAIGKLTESEAAVLGLLQRRLNQPRSRRGAA
jgi:DNA topoisomerase-1